MRETELVKIKQVERTALEGKQLVEPVSFVQDPGRQLWQIEEFCGANNPGEHRIGEDEGTGQENPAGQSLQNELPKVL